MEGEDTNLAKKSVLANKQGRLNYIRQWLNLKDL